ncbi:MAG: RNA polymerase sigma factor [Gammaproteobacteria bacterium]
MPDTSLVRRAQAGDAAALEQLLAAWYPRLLRQAALQLDRDDAGDVVQETLLKVTQNIGSLANPNAFPKWVFEILRRRGIDHLRRERRHRDGRMAFDESLLVELRDEEKRRVSALDTRSLLEDSLRYLGRDGFEIVRLRFVNGLSLKEIASVIRVPLGTVKSRLHVARGRLRHRLAYNP